ncbi:MAG TPA: type IV secretory system conjugative DNA transfer family protein [Planctomycetaceae bacterium]|jgi:type IV secretion system protein VirD4
MNTIRSLLIATVLLGAYLAAIVIYVVPYAWLAVVAVAVWVACRKRYHYTAHGTARWADASDIPHLLEGNGLIVGHIAGKASKITGVKALFDSRLSPREACQTFLTAWQRKQPKHLVRLTNAVHTACFAPTGVGKGVSCVVPFLLTVPESTVVVDFKGELTRITADARREMGHKVVILDPYKMTTQSPDTFNPLDFIDRESPTALDDCRDLAEALVVRSGQEKEPHWCDSAEVWIAAMTAMVVCFAESADKSMQSVRALLTDPEKMQAAIKIMCESDLWDGMLSRLGHQLTQFKDKELSSTLTTTNRFLRFLDTIAVAENTKKSSFNPADLLTGKMTVYLVLPPEHLRAQSPLLRLWIGSMLRAVVKGGLQETTKVHFILDEAASLGHMEVLDDAVDKLRGYGVRLQLYYQSLGQLKTCWPEGRDQTLLSNCTQVFFGVNDQQTAEYVSNRLGDETIVVASGGTGSSTSRQGSPQGGHNYSYSTSTNDNWQQLGRKLLKPEEVTATDPRVAITFTPGVPPIATWLVRYYENDFGLPRGMGLMKAAFDAACLFLAVLMLATWFTAELVYHTFQ